MVLACHIVHLANKSFSRSTTKCCCDNQVNKKQKLENSSNNALSVLFIIFPLSTHPLLQTKRYCKHKDENKTCGCRHCVPDLKEKAQ